MEVRNYRENDLNRTGRPTARTSQTKLSGIQSRYELNRTSRPSFVFLQTFLLSSQLPGVSHSEHPPCVVEFESCLEHSCCNKVANWGYLSRLALVAVSDTGERRLVVDSGTKKFAEEQMNGRAVRFSSYRLVKLGGND